jgi:hypothetical protein
MIAKVHGVLIAIVIAFCAANLEGCSYIAPSFKPTPTSQIVSTPAKLRRTPTYPTEYFGAHPYNKDSCLKTTQYYNNMCVAGEEYDSARALDKFQAELDSEFPNGGWELALNRLILPQEEWESDKQAYCEITTEDYLGGSGYGAAYGDCIYQQNLHRIDKLMWAACFKTNFSKCPPRKPGGEAPIITAIPMATSTP